MRHGRMDPCFHVLYAKFWPYHLNVAAEIETHQTRQRFSNLLLSNFGEPVRIVASVSCSWQERHLVWSSAAEAHLLQGSTCCALRDGVLYTLVVSSGYLSYCCLSIISNQSAHSPLTSDINKAFSSTQRVCVRERERWLFKWWNKMNRVKSSRNCPSTDIICTWGLEKFGLLLFH